MEGNIVSNITCTIVCHGCHGKKQVAPLGGILRACAICNGVGHVLSEQQIIPKIPTIADELKEKYESVRHRRRGPRNKSVSQWDSHRDSGNNSVKSEKSGEQSREQSME